MGFLAIRSGVGSGGGLPVTAIETSTLEALVTDTGEFILFT